MNIKDYQYRDFGYRLNQVDHYYGKNVHIVKNILILNYLARLGSPHTLQPDIEYLIQDIYNILTNIIVNNEFAVKDIRLNTRMDHLYRDRGVYFGPIVDPDQKVVVTNIIRSGIIPAGVIYSHLAGMLSPRLIRQDHVVIEKKFNAPDNYKSAKIIHENIEGPINNAIVIIPEPMGASGNTSIQILDLYTNKMPNQRNINLGQAKKIIFAYLVVTPECVRTIHQKYPEAIIYAGRLDRGLSDELVLQSKPGQYINVERGLSDEGYIVPGLGNISEIVNNTEE